MHIHTIDDDHGDLLDVVNLCSDSCHRAYAGDDYNGWNGCHETEHPDYCASCGVVIPGTVDDDGTPCDCQTRNVVVNRFLSDDGERCEHGNWIQLPSAHLGFDATGGRWTD
jgi:hypothetical protein